MDDSRSIFFLDIDNCLYSKNTKISAQMVIAIERYLSKHLSLNAAEAAKLHAQYLETHGLAIRGLVQDHKIDPLEFNSEVDDALPLEEAIGPDLKLRKLLQDIDRNKVKLWLFTNAYVTHGKRVVRLLGIDDLFEGITYCDYTSPRMLCKPHPDMFVKAMVEAGAKSTRGCYFVDDSAANCAAAQQLGWEVAHFLEEGSPESKRQIPCKNQIRSLQELRTLFPHLFRQ